jgi:hypothetical protein
MMKMGVRGWRKISRARDAWKLILKDAKVLHGPCIQWGREVRKWAQERSCMDHASSGEEKLESGHKKGPAWTMHPVEKRRS